MQDNRAWRTHAHWVVGISTALRCAARLPLPRKYTTFLMSVYCALSGVILVVFNGNMRTWTKSIGYSKKANPV